LVLCLPRLAVLISIEADVNEHLALAVPWIAELFAVLTSHLRGLDDIIN
jgi:hypothetical protein